MNCGGNFGLILMERRKAVHSMAEWKHFFETDAPEGEGKLRITQL